MLKKGHHLVEINRPAKSQTVILSQSDHFKQMAEELGFDEDATEFATKLEQIARSKQPAPAKPNNSG